MTEKTTPAGSGNAVEPISAHIPRTIKIISGVIARYQVEVASGYPPDVAEHWLRRKLLGGWIRGWSNPWFLFDDYVCEQDLSHEFTRGCSLEFTETSNIWTLDHICMLESELMGTIAREFHTAHAGAGSDQLSSKCRVWLAGHMRQSPDRAEKSKGEWQKEAQAMFPGLSSRAFDRSWNAAKEETGASNWGQAGRKSSR